EELDYILALAQMEKYNVQQDPASEDILNGTIMQRIYELENDLPEVHGNVLCRIEEAQQKQKAQYDRHIKATPDLDIGDRVLVFDARKAGTHSHKLAPKWKGLYYVHKRLPN
ncbi:10871_t:CDS:2, partial [Gigaspora rosea]